MHRLWPWDLLQVVLKPVFYTETETSLLHVHFSLTGSMIVLVGWHNLRYIRTDQHADSLFYSQGPCGLPQNFPPRSPSNCPWWELYLQVSYGPYRASLTGDIRLNLMTHKVVTTCFSKSTLMLLCNITHFYHEEMNIT